ncbi:Oligopeptide transport ATP-binding protein OppF (TC 3.A.1.5.1) [hydrothermal vent metagenome]|uniref:Oligopeptide transport ATP-binding protein OppF (TC 3.A.1.5.1) n=1 Tax=hydrothermal vent metagenome TaxID=652676 RepID=A0A3B0TGT0_9ZZZZ
MAAPTQTPLLEAVHLVRDYPRPRQGLFERPSVSRALGGVSLTIQRGSSLGLIGESGSGKSTLARMVVALEKPDVGTVRLDGEDLFAASPLRLRTLRRRLAMVFQDPYGSLDPRHPILRIVEEPLRGLERRLGRAERMARVEAVVKSVGLRPEILARYPHEFSGGQRQRIAIARALITEPELIVADEAVSALDVSIQAQILNLMMDLKQTAHLTYLFISHDLNVVRHVTEQVAVLYQGRIVERGPTGEVFANPAHPYTQSLIEAVPKPDPRTRRRPKPPPPDAKLRAGRRACSFSPRCPKANDRCRSEDPDLVAVAAGREASCFFPR